MKASAQVPKRAVYLAVLPIAAFLLFEATLVLFATRPSFHAFINSTANPWLESAARLQYLSLGILFFSYSLFIIWRFIFEFTRYYRSDSRGRIILIYLLCLIGASAVLIPLMIRVIPGTEDFISESIFDRAFYLMETQDIGSSWNRTTFEISRGITSFVTALALSCLVTSGISCVSRFDGLTAAENWRFQSERLRFNVFASSGLLVVGVLYFMAWTSYPAFLIAAGEQRESFSTMIKSLSMFTGIEFTVILCSYALPVTFVLSQRANRIAAQIVMKRDNLPAPPSSYPFNVEIEEVKRSQKLTVTAQEVVQTLVALLAPVITGTVASLTSFTG